MRQHSLAFLWIVSMICVLPSPSRAKEEKDAPEDDGDRGQTSYGLDVSFPIHWRVSTNYPHLEHNVEGGADDSKTNSHPAIVKEMPLQPLGNRHQIYLDHLEGCRNYHGEVRGEKRDTNMNCDNYEYDRLLMNRRQPQSMVNLTKVGFAKIRAPPHLKELVDEFWTQNSDKAKDEVWPAFNSYVNYWDKPTRLVSVDDKGLRGSGARLKEHVWAATSAVIEEWTEQEIQPCSLYGIRVYQDGAVMLPHVDRLPLVASAILNVAQDVDEPWPTEVYDHDGIAHNVTLEPGEMLLFESHSVVHGHPFPLKGRFYASIFIHFEPTGHALGKNESGFFYRKDDGNESGKDKKSSGSTKSKKQIEEEYRKEAREGHGGQSSSLKSSLPPYIQRESPEEWNWLRAHPKGWKPPADILPPNAHIAAKKGLLKDLMAQYEEYGQQMLTERDTHGWQVLHQGVASGKEEIVEFLINNGAEINARTHGGYGETPLRIAEKRLGLNSPIVQYLKKMGALSIGPEL